MQNLYYLGKKHPVSVVNIRREKYNGGQELWYVSMLALRLPSSCFMRMDILPTLPRPGSSERARQIKI